MMSMPAVVSNSYAAVLKESPLPRAMLSELPHHSLIRVEKYDCSLLGVCYPDELHTWVIE